MTWLEDGTQTVVDLAASYIKWKLSISGLRNSVMPNRKPVQFEILHRYHGNLFEVVKTLKNYSLVKLLFGGVLVIIPQSNYSGQWIRLLSRHMEWIQMLSKVAFALGDNTIWVHICRNRYFFLVFSIHFVLIKGKCEVVQAINRNR